MRAAILSIPVLLAACRGPCGPDAQRTDDPVGPYAEIGGYPAGTVACRFASLPDEPRVAYAEGDEQQAATRFTEHMAAQGYAPLPLPEGVARTNTELTIAGVAGTPLLFGKDGSNTRYYAELKAVAHGDVVVELIAAQCEPGKPNADYCG
jgi:hypothetical protein